MHAKSLLLLAFFFSSAAFAADSSGFPGGDKTLWLKANGFFAEGNLFAGKKKYSEAIGKYQQAISVFPDDFHYHYNLGLTLKKKGDLSGAVASLKRAAELNKSKWQIFKALGNALYMQGSYEEAKAAFAQCLAANPPAKEVVDINAALKAMGSKSAK